MRKTKATEDDINITIRWKTGMPERSLMVLQRESNRAMMSKPLSSVRILAVSGLPDRNGGTVITNKPPKATGISAVEVSAVVDA